MAQQQQLLAALHALYHHEDPTVKDQANKWLEQWQQTTEAWSVSDAVLHDPASNMEAQYFCAQTLRTKVRAAHPRGCFIVLHQCRAEASTL